MDLNLASVEQQAPAVSPRPGTPDAFGRCPWRLRDVALGLGLLTLWRLASMMPVGWLSGPVMRWLFWVALAAPMLLGLLFPAWIIRRRGGWQPQGLTLGRVLREAAWAVPLALAALMAAGGLVWTLRRIFAGGAPLPPPFAGMEAAGFGVALTLGILAVTLGPISEEVFFRGFLFNALRQRRLSAVLAGGLQAAAFTVMHRYGPCELAGVFLLGLILTAIYAWRRTLLTPVLVHALINVLPVVSLVMAAARFENGPVLGVYTSIGRQGLAVDYVAPQSAAASADVRTGDILLRYNWTKLSSHEDLIRLVQAGRVGDRAYLDVVRGGERLRKTVVLKSRAETLDPQPPRPPDENQTPPPDERSNSVQESHG